MVIKVDLRWDYVNGYDDTIYPVDFHRSGQIDSKHLISISLLTLPRNLEVSRYLSKEEGR